MRAPTSTQADAPRRSTSSQGKAPERAQNEPTPRSLMEAFRSALDADEALANSSDTAQQSLTDLPEGASSDVGDERLPPQYVNADEQESHLGETEFVQLSQLMIERQSTSMPAPAQVLAASQSAGLAELIEKHVRQMLVSSGGLHEHRDGKLMLRLGDEVFPDTVFTLSKSAGGWLLQTQSKSPDTWREISRMSPALTERFDTGGLGKLTVEASLGTE